MDNSGMVASMPKRTAPRTPFANHIKNLRAQMNWTQDEAASQPAWKMSAGHYRAIETGKNPTKPVIDMLVALYAGLPGATYEILNTLSNTQGELSQTER